MCRQWNRNPTLSEGPWNIKYLPKNKQKVSTALSSLSDLPSGEFSSLKDVSQKQNWKWKCHMVEIKLLTKPLERGVQVMCSDAWRVTSPPYFTSSAASESPLNHRQKPLFPCPLPSLFKIPSLLNGVKNFCNVAIGHSISVKIQGSH